MLKHKPAPREVLHGSPLWQWRRRPRSLCQRCCAQASSRPHSAWLSQQGARTYDSLQSKEWITPTRSKLLNWKKHDPDCLTDRPPRCQINSTKPKDQISLQGWKIRIQIAYVRVWGAPFRTAGTEEKGRTYLLGARRRPRARWGPISAAARPVVAAGNGKTKRGDTEKGTGKETAGGTGKRAATRSDRPGRWQRVADSFAVIFPLSLPVI